MDAVMNQTNSAKYAELLQFFICWHHAKYPTHAALCTMLQLQMSQVHNFWSQVGTRTTFKSCQTLLHYFSN